MSNRDDAKPRMTPGYENTVHKHIRSEYNKTSDDIHEHQHKHNKQTKQRSRNRHYEDEQMKHSDKHPKYTSSDKNSTDQQRETIDEARAPDTHQEIPPMRYELT